MKRYYTEIRKHVDDLISLPIDEFFTELDKHSDLSFDDVMEEAEKICALSDKEFLQRLNAQPGEMFKGIKESEL